MKKIILSIFAALAVTACTNFLEDNPTGNFTDDDMNKVPVEKAAEKMLVSAKEYMHTMGSGTAGTSYKVIQLAMDLKGNDMVLPIAGGGGWFISDYNLDSYRGFQDGRAVAYWTNFYKLVFMANQVLEFLPEDPATSSQPEAVKNIKAKALTLRAFAYYHLICIYQDAYLQGGKDKAGVPLYFSTTDPAGPRGTAAGVYGQILKDCSDAIALFNESGVAASGKDDVSVYVTYMVQARTALEMGENSLAASAAKNVIDGFTLMSKTQALDNGFQKLDGPETIWGYKWTQNTTLNNSAFSSHISTNVAGAYAGEQGGYKMIDSRLYNQIEPTDWRKGLYYDVPTDIYYAASSNPRTITVPAYCNSKFNAPDFYQDEIYMRVAEAYFIRAEALVTDNVSTAQQVLYDIVSTRDAAYTKSAKTGQALLDEIRLQKRIEMWGEGLEYFDNKRIGKGVDRTGVTNHTNSKVVPAGKDFTFRIPKAEIERNPNIKDEDNNPI